MNFASPALWIAIVACLPHIWKAIKFIWQDGKKDGEDRQQAIARTREFANQAENFQRIVDNLQQKLENSEAINREDVQKLYEAISLNNNLQNQRYHEFYKEFSDFRFQVARYMKNGGTH